jgi:carbon-monoxide dehydrogenase medium subunit
MFPPRPGGQEPLNGSFPSPFPVKPAPFEYVPARSAAEAVKVLAGEGASVLAGGQSLVFEMNFRRSQDAHRDRHQPRRRPRPPRRRREAAGGRTCAPRCVRRREWREWAPGKLGRPASWAACWPRLRDTSPTRRSAPGGPWWEASPTPTRLPSGRQWPSPSTPSSGSSGQGACARSPQRSSSSALFATARGDHELVAEVQLPLIETGAGFTEHRRTAASFALVAAVTAVVSAAREMREGPRPRP